jgi:hypothetical protein
MKLASLFFYNKFMLNISFNIVQILILETILFATFVNSFTILLLFESYRVSKIYELKCQ